MLKQMIAIYVGLVVAVGIVVAAPPVAAAVSLKTGDSRMNLQLSDEALVVTELERAYNTYELTFVTVNDTINSETLDRRARNVVEANQKLQEKTFSTRVSQQFSDATREVKQAAQALTDTVVATSKASYTTSAQAEAATAQLTSRQEAFDKAVAKLETGAENYMPNNWWIVFVVLGVIALGIIGAIIAVWFQKRKIAERIFGSDMATAGQLQTDQKELVTRLYRDVKLYQQALDRQNTALAEALEGTAFKEYFQRTDQGSFGSFAAIAFEYRALVNARLQKQEEAKADAQKARELRGTDEFLTSRGRELAR